MRIFWQLTLIYATICKTHRMWQICSSVGRSRTKTLSFRGFSLCLLGPTDSRYRLALRACHVNFQFLSELWQCPCLPTNNTRVMLKKWHTLLGGTAAVFGFAGAFDRTISSSSLSIFWLTPQRFGIDDLHRLWQFTPHSEHVTTTPPSSQHELTETKMFFLANHLAWHWQN